MGLSEALSNRMLFGLSCGSKGLDEKLGLIFEEIITSEVILLLVFVDDFARGGVDDRHLQLSFASLSTFCVNNKVTG